MSDHKNVVFMLEPFLIHWYLGSCSSICFQKSVETIFPPLFNENVQWCWPVFDPRNALKLTFSPFIIGKVISPSSLHDIVSANNARHSAD